MIEYVYQWDSVSHGFTHYNTRVQHSFGSESPSSQSDVVESAYLELFQTYMGCGYNDDSRILCDAEGMDIVTPGNPCFAAEMKRREYIAQVANNIVQITNNGYIELESDYDTDFLSKDFDRVVHQRFGGDQRALTSDTMDADQFKTTYPDFVFTYVEPSAVGDGALMTSSSSSLEPGVAALIESAYELEDIECLINEEGDRGTYTQLAGDAPGSSAHADCLEYRTPEIETYQVSTGQSLEFPALPLTCMDNYAHDIHACDPDRIQTAMNKLTPRDLLPTGSVTAYAAELTRPLVYYPAPQAQQPSDTQLFRTRLSCEQIAAAQVLDPTHNNLLHRFKPIQETKSVYDHEFERIIGGRERIEADNNRICSWTQTKRGDSIRVYGMNYRGQALVELMRTHSKARWVHREHRYNADGNLTRETQPSVLSNTPVGSDLQRLAASQPHTIYEYDDSNLSDLTAYDSHIPLFWARRHNMISQTYLLTAPVSVLDQDVPVSLKYGERTEYTHEPLFNQLHHAVTGIITEPGNPNAFLALDDMVIDYDYQEFDVGSIGQPFLGLGAWLSRSIKQGYFWDHQYVDTQPAAIPSAFLLERQLRIPLYGADLNGDGLVGHPSGATNQAGRVRGLPVRVTIRAIDPINQLAKNDTRRSGVMAYNPEGHVTFRRSITGAVTVYDYYETARSGAVSTTQMFGSTTPPTDQDVSPAYGGLLARIRVNRFSSTPEQVDLPSRTRCSRLVGPYAWLLQDEDCESDPSTALLDLGLPEHMVEDILRVGHEPAQDEVSFSYNMHGRVRFIWQDNFAKSTWASADYQAARRELIYDADGRVAQMTAPDLTRTIYSYDLRGNLVHTILEDSSEQLGLTSYVHDNEGRVLASCTRLGRGTNECSTFHAAHQNAPPVLGTPGTTSYALRVYEYDVHGRLVAESDNEGRITSYFYAGHYGELTAMRIQPVVSSDPSMDRWVVYSYDSRGRLSSERIAVGVGVDTNGAYDPASLTAGYATNLDSWSV